MKLVTQIRIMVGLPILAISLVCGVTAYWTSSALFNKDAADDLAFRQWNMASDVQRSQELTLGLAKQFCTRPDVIEAVKEKNLMTLRGLGQEMMKQNGVTVVVFTDKAGTVIARAHSDKQGDSIAYQQNIQKALAGNTVVGIEEGTVVKFSLRGTAPVKSGQDVIGCVTLGYDMTTDAYVDSVKARYKTECTIFQKDKRVATTLATEGKRLIGTKMDSQEVLDAVLEKGEIYNGLVPIQGRYYNGIYWPIRDSNDKITGMFFLGKSRQEVRESLIHFVKVTVTALVIVTVICLVLASVFGHRIASRIGKVISSVGDCSHQMAGAAAEIATASHTLAEGASEQASSLEESSSTLEEIASISKTNADGAAHATELLTKARGTADHGREEMAEMSKAMDEIKSASNSIAKIIKTIDEIAFQTNILALNAAVEAARAGEAGLGFAVVADEVRKLAQRAAQAAKETAVLIEDCKNRSEYGVQLNHKVRASLEEIVTVVRETADIGQSTAQAAQEGSKGVEQVNIAMAELDKLTQSNAATAEESASASQQLNGLAGELREAVVQLEIMVNGYSKAADASHKPRTKVVKEVRPQRSLKA